MTRQCTPQVLYIMGAGRCGSTILSILLSKHEHMEAVGEIKMWPRHRGLPRDKETKAGNYRFWSKVLDRYLEAKGGIPDFNDLERICRSVESYRNVIHFFCGQIPQDLASAYDKHNIRLLSAIYMVSKKKIIVDSSKNVCRAYSLLKNFGETTRVIHLIRDPRGTVWSFMKKGIEQESKTYFRTIFDYTALNLAGIAIRRLFPTKVLKITYEDLTCQTAATINKILTFMELNVKGDEGRCLTGSTFHLPNMIDGNRIRKNDSIVFRPDEEWKQGLPLTYKVLTQIFAMPVYVL